MAYLALLAAAAAVIAPVSSVEGKPSTDDRALFAAFKQVCSKVRAMDGMAGAARGAKWHGIAASAHPRLASLVDGGRAAVLASEPNAILTDRQFTKAVGGRTLWLAISRYQDKEGHWSNGCRIYDFDATSSLPRAQLVKLMGKPETGTLPLPDNQVKYLWEPGWKSGQSVEVSFMTGNDPASQKFGLKGLVLTAHAIGGF